MVSIYGMKEHPGTTFKQNTINNTMINKDLVLLEQAYNLVRNKQRLSEAEAAAPQQPRQPQEGAQEPPLTADEQQAALVLQELYKHYQKLGTPEEFFKKLAELTGTPLEDANQPAPQQPAQ